MRRRKPVIYNDYCADIPSKKGLPSGHVRITRFLGFPVFEGERIVAVGGVANKEQPYDQNDVESLRLLHEQVWLLVRRRQAEEKLRESEERLEVATALGSDYAYCHKLMEDGSLAPVWHVGSFDAITGYSPEELRELGGWATLIHHDDIPRAAEYVHTLLAGKPATCTARIVTKDGDVRWIEDNGRPWVDRETGTVIGTFGSAREITAQKNVELELRKQQALYRNLTERRRQEEDLRRIEWMLKPKEMPNQEPPVPEYGDLSLLNTGGLILSSVGKEQLLDLASEYLDLLETSAAVYEKNGDYALGLFSSGWCKLADRASRRLCETEDNREALESGKWICHESCWRDASQRAMETDGPVDVECRGGIRLYAVPVRANGEIIGAINFGYGDPPTDDATLEDLAERLRLPVDELKRASAEYQSRPPFIIDLAKRRLHKSAYYIGRLVERAVARQEMMKALEEKDFLMTELNHRVKNNLLMISSLIDLKNSSAKGSADLSDIKRQIDAIGIVHSRLYQTKNFTHVALRAYLDDLLAKVVPSAAGAAIRIEKDLAETVVPTRQAVPVALIVNELATNTVKHGLGGPAEQLGGSIHMQRSPSPVFTIRFPLSGSIAETNPS